MSSQKFRGFSHWATQTSPKRYRHITRGFLHFRILSTIAGPVAVTSSGF
jgi:hypothetical protein